MALSASSGLLPEAIATARLRMCVTPWHVGDPIPPEDTRAIEDMASYLVRSAISLKRLVYIDGQKACLA